jgi:hypothetical protein
MREHNISRSFKIINVHKTHLLNTTLVNLKVKVNFCLRKIYKYRQKDLTGKERSGLVCPRLQASQRARTSGRYLLATPPHSPHTTSTFTITLLLLLPPLLLLATADELGTLPWPLLPLLLLLWWAAMSFWLSCSQAMAGDQIRRAGSTREGEDQRAARPATPPPPPGSQPSAVAAGLGVE